ncbi:MAG: tetratricopeptide repeat protein [Gemmatimonadales bacterium]
MTRNVVLLVGCMVAMARGASGQVAAGDSAWNEGRFEDARAAYLAALRNEPAAARPNLRLGVLLSWDGKLDSALVLLARARAGDPENEEMTLVQARVMSWNKQFDDATARYDSLLARNPDLHEASLGRARALAWAGRLADAARAYDTMLARDSTDRDAEVGRAQVAAWLGDLAGAGRRYQAALGRDPGNLDALVGSGYVYHWQGQDALAGRQARRAMEIDSTYQTARELRQVVQAALQPAVEFSVGWSHDSDNNTDWWQSMTVSSAVSNAVRGFLSSAVLEASDPGRNATRVSAEAGLYYSTGPATVTAALGVRRLSADLAPSRTPGTWRTRLDYRISPAVSAGVGYARYPFDEIAGLIARRLDLDAADAGVTFKPTRELRFLASGGGIWFSDGNRRESVQLLITRTLGPHFFVGSFGRMLWFDHQGTGYFSPNRFTVLEGQAGYIYDRGAWSGFLSGGLGGQQVAKTGVWQSQWHLDARIGKLFGGSNRADLFGTITNSAVSSTSGAFRYQTAGISLRIGL